MKGTFCISFDTELLWGRHDGEASKFIDRAKKTRSTISSLLKILSDYDMPATWAIVGHLFLRECKRNNEKIHPEIVRGNFPWKTNDWFSEDPGTSYVKNQEWYGPDIVKQIKNTKNQEVGSHSFSHVQFGHPGCSKNCAESEVRECIKLAHKYNIKLNSFVFPYNSVGHVKLLKKYGFTVYRGDDQYSSHSLFSKLTLLLELFLPKASPVHKPKIREGLVEIPGSFYFMSARGYRRHVPFGIRFNKAKKGIDEAIRQKKIFHIWTHPIDFSDKQNELLKEFKNIVIYAANQRDKGLLSIQNMTQIAKEYKKQYQ